MTETIPVYAVIEQQEIDRQRKRLDVAWKSASVAGRLAFIDEDLVPYLGARVLRGEITEPEATETLANFREAAHWTYIGGERVRATS